MRKLIYIFSIYILFSEMLIAGVTSTLESKTWNSLQCYMDGVFEEQKITFIGIENIENKDNTITFRGVIEATSTLLFFTTDLDGIFSGKAKVIGDEIRITELKYGIWLSSKHDTYDRIKVKRSCLR